MHNLTTAHRALAIAQGIAHDIDAIQQTPVKLTKHQRAWVKVPADRQAAALKALADHESGAKPAGSYDNASRWWPDEEFECCAMIRSPSRAWPFSKLKHCLSLAHKEALHGADHEDVLALRRVLNERAEATDAGLPLVKRESQAWLETLEAGLLREAAVASAGASLPAREHARL